MLSINQCECYAKPEWAAKHQALDFFVDGGLKLRFGSSAITGGSVMSKGGSGGGGKGVSSGGKSGSGGGGAKGGPSGGGKGPGTGGGWPSRTGEPSGGGRSNGPSK